MAYDSKNLHCMEGIYSPAEGHVEAGKGHIMKTRYAVVVVESIFDLIRWWHRPTDCEVF